MVGGSAGRATSYNGIRPLASTGRISQCRMCKSSGEVIDDTAERAQLLLLKHALNIILHLIIVSRFVHIEVQ